MPRYVASTTLSGPLGGNVILIEGDVIEGVESLKAELTGDLITSGCGAFARHLAVHGLIDEARFWAHPTIGTRPGGETPLPAVTGNQRYSTEHC